MGLAELKKIADAVGYHPSDLTDAESLERYLSPENLRKNNLLPRRKKKTDHRAGRAFGKIFAFFQKIFALFQSSKAA